MASQATHDCSTAIKKHMMLSTSCSRIIGWKDSNTRAGLVGEVVERYATT
jgi:hypothetical protein